MIPRSFGDAWAAARRRFEPDRPDPGEPPAGDGPGPADSLAAEGDFRLDLVVLGAAGSGKTSLVRALLDRAEGQAAPAPAEGGATREVRGRQGTVRLTDTPGILAAGESGPGGEAEALDLAIGADLILFVVENDLLRAELSALSTLIERGKRAVVVLNKMDLFAAQDLAAIQAKVRDRLAGLVGPEDVVAVAADPRPVTVRLRKLDGTEETVLEYEAADLQALDARIEAILIGEAGALRAGNVLLGAYLKRKAADERLALERRERVEKIIDKYQWIAAAATVAIPLPQLDLMATGAVEYQMISAIAAEYGADLSPDHVRMISQQMIQSLVKQKVAETAATLLARALKSSVVGYAAGGLIGAVTIAYLTRITGRTFLEYFEHGQDWGQGGMPGALARQIDRHGRAEFLKDFVVRSSGKLVGWVAGAARPRGGGPA